MCRKVKVEKEIRSIKRGYPNMLSCIIRPQKAWSKIEIRSTEVELGSQKPDKIWITTKRRMEPSSHEEAKHSLNGPGVADRIRQCGSDSVGGQDGA